MKKSILFTSALLLALLLSERANAGGFFGLRVGSEKLQIDSANSLTEKIDDSENEYIFGAFLGYHYSFFRLEAEYMYNGKRKFGDSVEVLTHTTMGNLYFSPPTRIVVKPYFMAGVGAAFHSTEIGAQDDSNTDLAWHLGAGLELEFTENVFLEAGIRYVNMGEATVEKKAYEITGFNYFGGLRFEY